MELFPQQFEPERKVTLRDGTLARLRMTEMPDGNARADLSRVFGSQTLIGYSLPPGKPDDVMRDADELFARMCGENLRALGIDLEKRRKERPRGNQMPAKENRLLVVAAGVFAAIAAVYGFTKGSQAQSINPPSAALQNNE